MGSLAGTRAQRHESGGAPSRVRITIAPLIVICAAAFAACGEDMVDRDGNAISDGRSVSTDAGAWTRLPEVRGAAREGYGELAGVEVGNKAIVVAGTTKDAMRIGGLALDLDSRRWSRLPSAPLKWRGRYSVVATDTSVLVWGGSSNAGDFSDGARYDPIARRWGLLDQSPLSARHGHAAVWTGDEMAVWGGAHAAHGRPSGASLRDGALYDPSLGEWRSMREAPIAGRYDHATVWTGSEMLVWGGSDGQTSSYEPRRFFADGAAYSPEADSWRSIPEAPIRSRQDPEAVWTGDRMLVWNGARAAAYDPAGNEWDEVPAPPLGERFYGSAVWSGTELIVWGGTKCSSGGCGDLADGAAYSPSETEWAPLPASPLSPRAFHAAVWAGSAMVVWGGSGPDGDQLTDGASYEPAGSDDSADLEAHHAGMTRSVRGDRARPQLHPRIGGAP